MRTGGVPAALLLVLASTLLQVSTAGDIYWEGEEDAANEFLEVKTDHSISQHLKRFKRDWFDSLFPTVKDDTDDKDDDADNLGSGDPDKIDSEPGEKTIRVTFVVMEPYRTPEYSNRDSPEFQNFSHSLATAVDLLFEQLPGTQKSSLVRIQSLISDNFYSNVTLDIVTSGYDDTDNIIEILHDHIKQTRQLGSFQVQDQYFKAQLIDPALPNNDDTTASSNTNDQDGNNGPTDDQNNIDQTGDNGNRDTGDQSRYDNGDGDDNTGYGGNDDGRGDQTQDRDDDSGVGDNNVDKSTENTYSYTYGGNGFDDNPTDDNATDDNPKDDNPTDDNPTDDNPTNYNPTDDNPTDDNAADDNQTDDTQTDANPTYENEVGDNNVDNTTDASYQTGYPGNDADRRRDNDLDNNNTDQSNDNNDWNDNNEVYQPVDNDHPTATIASIWCENRIQCAGSSVTICPEQRCNGVPECPNGYDEQNCDERADTNGQPESSPWDSVTVPVPPSAECPSDSIQCDETRCVLSTQRCDGIRDCSDGTDELGCPSKTCEPDDFRCGNSKCIEAIKRCDGVHDCSDGSDEIYCDCSVEEFQCASDRSCIEGRKRCDNVRHCADGSDEENCNACGPAQWQCDHGNCIKLSQRCDGRADCPTDRSDERNCLGDWYFRCKSGKHISQHLRCNRHYDCPSGDFSDEHNCPCGDSDFKCNNGYCIPASKRCDRTRDCQDGSDERHCTYGKVCMAYECTSGICVQAESRCNGTIECDDGSDEVNCPCKRGQHQCQDGSCINIAYLCNGRDDCSKGEDEYNCHVSCPADQITCNGGNTPCGVRCNNVEECEGGEDENDCDEACSVCSDGTCIPKNKICDGNRDCSDGADEASCYTCDGPNDFRCNSGECLTISVHCNELQDCEDNSDELDCNSTMTATTEICGESQFRCKSNNVCIQDIFECDGQIDCVDESDEADCPWYMVRAVHSPDEVLCHASQFKCYNGRCIPQERRCDNIYDCTDFSDEQKCSNTGIEHVQTATTSASCTEFQCNSGGCIATSLYCDGKNDCSDGSDEIDCPAASEDPTVFRYPSTAIPVIPVQTIRPSIDSGNGQNPNYPYPQETDEQSGGSVPSGGQPDDREPYEGYPEGYTPTGGQPDDRRPDGGYPGGSGPSGGQPDDREPYGGYPGGNVPSGGQPGDREPYGGYPGGNGPSGGQPDDREPYGGYPGGNVPSGGQPGDREPYGGYPGGNRPSGGQSGDRGSYGGYPGSNGPSGGQSGDRGSYGGYPGSNGPSGGQSGDRGSYGGYPGSNGPSGGQSGDRGPYGGSGPSGGQNGGQGQYGSYPNGNTQSGGQSGDRGYSGGGGSSGGQYGGYPGGSGASGGQSGNRRPYPVNFGSTGGQDVCNSNQWRCENGPCIDSFRRCDGNIDCPFDYSDEFDCPSGSAPALELQSYPENETVRNGGDVVLRCRDVGPLRAPVRWVREGGSPIKPGSTDKNGRLEMKEVTLADAGVYICQAPTYLEQARSEIKVTVNVIFEQVTYHPIYHCGPNEATCGNGECIARSAICDKNYDCSDRTDEDNCHQDGLCEPNQFKCNNGKCVLKSWVCDSEHDCGHDDDSDERNCEPRPPNSPCLSTEFTCASDNMCIPRGYHCDRHKDCSDDSDESACVPAYITQPPAPSTKVLNPGETLILTCRAVGIPAPLITWRRNWGHVPPQCVSTSIDGVGTLTCTDMQNDHNGAYSCEVLTREGAQFATPDAIVFVNNTGLCPRGYFNDEARYESDCIRCFCFGESSQCHSADLFTYNMPTALGDGGTRLHGIKLLPSGGVQLDTKSITDRYYYEPLRNGATVTKLDRTSWSFYDSHPYLSLPETYNGNQLTSYGGHIKYTLVPQTRYSGNDNTAPTIIIKGKYRTLVHKSQASGSSSINIEARLTPEDWMKSEPEGLQPAAREDIMMALDDIELILLRADYKSAGVNITDFVMESAQHINVGLGAASLVEECTCPKGYEGLSCQKCASGYVRKSTGPWLGECVAEECPAGTYGNPSIGVPCKPCPCPLTNPTNQFASSCSLRPDGGVQCDCLPGYEGNRCEYCASGYVGNPGIPGDRCELKPSNNCNPTGTKTVRPPDECVCKDNVQGRFCDICKNETFYLSSEFRHGCAKCFCSAVSGQCKSSNLRRKTISAQFNVPQIVEQLKVYISAPSGDNRAVRYMAPVETQLSPQLSSGQVYLEGAERSSQSVYYWSLPASFAGDKVTAYGGYFHYTLKNVPTSADPRFNNNAADIQLISDNQLIFQYVGKFQPSQDGILNVTIQLLEKGWQRPDGEEIAREFFLLALADVKTILIKATYSNNFQVATPVSASIDVAAPDGNGPMAVHVEQCTCPAGYIGTSCEDCAPGYTRSTDGIYLMLCKSCECNGKSNICNPETGVCYHCADNTDGDQCEFCKPGYQKDANGECVSDRPTGQCQCDPRGTSGPCDSSGNCYCKQNVEGESCDRCRPGTFGLDSGNPAGCLSCFCSGATSDCHEANHYKMTLLPVPMMFEDYGGYTITDLQGEKVIKDDFVPQPEQSELMYTFQSSPDTELYWSIPILPGNRILSYGGSISLIQKFISNEDDLSQPGIDVILEGDNLSLFWTNPHQFYSDVPYNYQIPLSEAGWHIEGTTSPASRSNFMNVLRNLKRVLVRATLVPNLYSTSIADVSMSIAVQSNEADLQVAKGIEVCMCPPGYSGTSCEDCKPGYYQDYQGNCQQCSCNGHGCQLDAQGQVVCNCEAPYKGPDCSTIGLVMELHPKIHEADLDDKLLRRVTFTCKYRAPEPLTIKFYHEDEEQRPAKYFNESSLQKDGWHGQHVWHTVWDARQEGEIYECHTITEKGFTLGILTTSLPEPGGDSSVLEPATTRSPVPQSTVSVIINSPVLVIRAVGGSVNFTCQAVSLNTRAHLPVQWSKSGGYLPQDRSYVDENSGLLMITRLQAYDSGVYICESSDGINTEQATATLQVPGNEMTLPVVEIEPIMRDYYEGDVIELVCRVTAGNPAPTIRWHRGSNRPLPLNAQSYENTLVIESAMVEDAGEYTCVGTNTVGSAHRTSAITVRPRPSQPSREKLFVSNLSPKLDEGQSIRIVCTGSPNIAADSIDWSRQDNDIQANVYSENGVLYISNAIPDNQGVYICKSIEGEVSPVQILVTVVRLGPPSPAPDITIVKDHLVVPTGGSASIECTPSGLPLPIIKWSKHEGEFSSGVEQRGSSLIINGAQENDGGYYICEGSVRNDVFKNVYVYVEIERHIKPVVEIWPKGEQAVTLGGEFELWCRVLGGTPEPTVTWSRGGDRPLSSFTNILKEKLSFENIEVNDEGEYICTVSNIAGTTSASATIKVRSAPVVTITPNNVIHVVNGDPFNIECRGQGNPQPMMSIKSLADHRDVVPPALGYVALRVRSAGPSDDGEYVCTATSIAGTIDEQISVTVDRGDGGYDGYDDGGSGDVDNVTDPPTYEEPASMIVYDNQDQTYIDCATTDRVEWSKPSGEPLQSNAIPSGSRLYIYNVTKSDSGEYVCNVFDNYDEIVRAAYTRLFVVTPPRITLRPHKAVVQPGQSPTVECLVDGDDIIRVAWRPVGRTPSSRVDTSTNVLIFHRIEVEDAGFYECFAESRYGNTSSTVEVIVTEDTDRSPSVSHANEQFARAGSAVHLSCNVTQADVHIVWTKDGGALPRSVRRKNSGSLYIRLAQASDTGRYVCSIRDAQGRELTRNYINLHIEGIECLETEFRCYDYSGCIKETLLCDGFRDCRDNSDEENCLSRDRRYSAVVQGQHLVHNGSYEPLKLASIIKPQGPFRTGDNVKVTCRTIGRDTRAEWQRPGTNQFIVPYTYGDGAILEIQGVTYNDAGVYRCVATDNLGRTSYEEFTLVIEPGTSAPVYPYGRDGEVPQYTARLLSSVDLPCNHNLELPVYTEWRREFTQLPPNVRADQPNLRLDSVTESDAGTYVCRVSNDRVTVEAKAILVVTDVVPMFQGDGYISLPTLKDAFWQFKIEISIKPTDKNGLILYNSELQGRSGDYIALLLKNGVPEFIIKTDGSVASEPLVIKGDRPLQLNAWHTIRLSRVNSKVNMDVDNTGTSMAESEGLRWSVLDLKQPLYIGGVPDFDQLPVNLSSATGYIGCVSMLVLRDKETNIMTDSSEQYRVSNCNSCAPNLCYNNGVCQEALNERGYSCICQSGYAGLNCDRTGEACRPGLCGPGKCTDTDYGYKCACPVTHTGKNCDVKQSIEYPAFSGSTFFAINAPKNARTLKMSMNLKAASPVTDGIIMYCAESARGYGGFTSLAVHNGKLEFRYDAGGGSTPVVLVSNKTLPENEWITVHIARIGRLVSLKINQSRFVDNYERQLDSPKLILNLNTPVFVGGVDETTILNNNTGVVGGFSGCIKDFTLGGVPVDIVNDTIKSENVQECNNIIPRGDIPEYENRCQCRNGGTCTTDSTSCACPHGYTGQLCEQRVPSHIQSSRQPYSDPCTLQPCRNGATCRTDRSSRTNYTCDCGLGYAGATCQMRLSLAESVGFIGNGYLELPANNLRYEQLYREPAIIAMAVVTTERDGVLLYQKEAQSLYSSYGDYILLRIENGIVILEWDEGGGKSTVSIDSVYISDGERHQIIAKLEEDGRFMLSVDEHQNTETTTGLLSTMSADSNIYIGGIPENMNYNHYPGFNGCIEQVELMDSTRGINFDKTAIAGRNTQRCKGSR